MSILTKIQSVRGKKYYVPTPDWQFLGRRVLKLGEEAGELSQAYLDVTAENPARGKTEEDVLEEAVDAAIVALDIALVVSGGRHQTVNEMIDKKVAKWKAKVIAGTFPIK